jgi:saccharopine dehydrogenase-like NADP-dependent oxidoreductase
MLRKPPWLQVLLVLLRSPSHAPQLCVLSLWWQTTPRLRARAHGTYFISPAFAFVAYPNRDSIPFKEFYNIPEAETVVRGTLRYQGFPEFIKTLVQLGWLATAKKEWLKEGLMWAEVTQKVTGANEATEGYVLLTTRLLDQLNLA